MRRFKKWEHILERMVGQEKINIEVMEKVILFILWFLAPFYLFAKEIENPNIVIFFADDLGYGDLGCYGNQLHKTPNIDALAREGIKFTSFYVTSGVCTPSRASLLTGCYPRRVDMDVNERTESQTGRQVLFPNSPKGLNVDEITIAEVLKEAGYKTACIGKWHLGDQKQFLPRNQGFDYYFGLPYSNDMGSKQIPLPLLENNEVIDDSVDQSYLTQRYTSKALEFIKENQRDPFFLYMPYAMPHRPQFASKNFMGKSSNGIYGDAVEELDWSVGEIVKLLVGLNLEQNTLIIFLSDNGAAPRYGGSNLPLSGWKGSTLEGAQRVPCIIKWPQVVPPQMTVKTLITSMDFLPTFAKIIGVKLPPNRIDGHNILSILSNPKKAKSPYKAFYYYQKEQLQAVRYKNWKLHLPLDSTYKSIHYAGFIPGKDLQLFNLDRDMGETSDVAKEYPWIVKKMLKLSDKMMKDLGTLGVKPKNQRKAGMVSDPRPLLKVDNNN